MKLFVAALASALILPLATPSGVAEAAPAGNEEVVAFVVRGVGNGHGRGMSQWGAYGRALAGQSWQEILAAYYGGTTNGSVASDQRIAVRLTALDNQQTVSVISLRGQPKWGDQSYAALQAREVGSNLFEVWGATIAACPGAPVPDVVLRNGDVDVIRGGTDVRELQAFLESHDFELGGIDGWFGDLTTAAVRRFQSWYGLTQDGVWNADEIAQAATLAPNYVKLTTEPVAGPISFTAAGNESTLAPTETLGLCRPNGSVLHYRGSLKIYDNGYDQDPPTGSGNRVVNDVLLENYVRGVVPREIKADWPAQALAAQAVAARSYGSIQKRSYWTSTAKSGRYATTCDTTSCQVYGGASAEQPTTDQAVTTTASVVRVSTANSQIVSTEFSASNGPSTAGGWFPVVDDHVFDDQPGNPYHRWTRIIDADAVRAKYGLASANSVATRPDRTPASPPYDGIWANEVVLGGGMSPVNAWTFRNDFGLPSPGFELIPIRRTLTAAGSFAFIGDSVGVTISTSGSSFQAMTEGVFSSSRYDSLASRPTKGGASDGVSAAKLVPLGTDLVVVELGYNDSPSTMGSRIDAVMTELRARNVGRVAWLTVSQRKSSADYGTTNAAIAAAVGRWEELELLDWESASDHSLADRWYSSDGVHLTTSGNSEFALWLRDQVVELLPKTAKVPHPLYPNVPLRVPVLGVGGVPSSGVVGVALNVTAVRPSGDGWIRVWPCGSAQPETSSVNYRSGQVAPNAVVVPVDSTGAVCVVSLQATDVVIDVSAWFDSGLQSATGRLLDSRKTGGALAAGKVLRVPVLGRSGVPSSGVAGVALNVTAVRPSGDGWIRVWPCGSAQPETSSVNYRAGEVAPNAVVVPVDSTGEVCVVSLQATDVVVDVSAWFDSGLQSATGRLLDSRKTGGALAAGKVLRVPVLGRSGVPSSGVAGVALNVTAVRPSGDGWIRVWPCGSAQPETSSVNYRSGEVAPNAVVVPVDSTGEVCVVSLKATDVVIDVSAWFDSGLRGLPGARIVDTRNATGPIPTR